MSSPSQLVFEYISQREGEHLSNAEIAEGVGLPRQVVARVMHYGMKTCKSLFKVRRAVWVFNPEEEIIMEKAKVIQLMEMFEESPTLSASEISSALNLSRRQVTDMVKRVSRELNAEINSQTQYTFKGWK